MNLFKKKKLWRNISFALIPLATLCITGTYVANEFSNKVNEALGIKSSKVTGSSKDAVHYTSSYNNLDEMFNAKVKLMRNIGQEGTVLLKNDGILPLKESSSVTVLNSKEVMYEAKVGGGTFDSEEIRNNETDIVDALNSVGLNANKKRSKMSESDATIVVIGRNWQEGSDMTIGELDLTFDEKDLIDTAITDAKKVIIFISGDFYPNLTEYVNNDRISAIVRLGNAGMRGLYGFADVIAGKASPSGKLVDTYAASYNSSPAMQNFGDFRYTNQNKLMASQASKYVVYQEGIYVDYRYYETRYEDCVLNQGLATSSKGAEMSQTEWKWSNEVLFPFGYGLSYTTFSKEIVGTPKIDKADRSISIDVKVTNTGNFAGKEVVQIYGQSPYTEYDKANKVEKSSVQLLGFEKTKELAIGASETLTANINLDYFASYDYTKAKTYIFDDGDYYLSVGGSAHEALNNILASKGKTVADGMNQNGDANLTYKWHEDTFDSTTFAKSKYTNADITNRFDDADVNYWSTTKYTYLSRNNWLLTYPSTINMTGTQNLIDCINDTKKYENASYNDTKKRAPATEVTYQDYKTSDEVNAAIKSGKLETKNVITMRGKAYDDEGWKDILDNLSIYEISNLISEGNCHIEACPSVVFPSSISSDGPTGIRSDFVYSKINPTTGEKTALTSKDVIKDEIAGVSLSASKMDASCYESSSVIAATFNKDLARQKGEMFGEDGLYTNTASAWSFGSNIHRTPYCGRTSEYMSADATLTALIGIEMSKGCNEKGVALVAKHFAFNEQDQNRIGIATFSNEQALREVYLRAFEEPCTTGEMKGLMSSYNRIGLIGTNEEYDLLTGILREEWGSQAYIISDMNSPTAGLYDGNAAIAAGLSVELNNGSFNSESGTTVSTSLNIAGLKSDPTLLYAAREACHRIFYCFIHTNAVNGIDENSKIVFVTPWWSPLLISLDVVMSVAAVGALSMYVLSERHDEKEAA